MKSRLDVIDLVTSNDLVQRVQDLPISKEEIFAFVARYDTKSLCNIAQRLRDSCKSGPITYSRKVFINLINLCRDSCSYCTYKKEFSDFDLSMSVSYTHLRAHET